jgi:DNA-binding CsgD family transcriptional regulator
MRVVKLYAEGKRESEISAELHVTLNTVVAHRRQINDRLGGRTITQSVAIAVQLGLIEVGQGPGRRVRRVRELLKDVDRELIMLQAKA